MIHPEKRRENLAKIEIEKRLKECCYNNDGHCYLSIIGCMKDTECDAKIEGNKIICSCYIPNKKKND